jgi:hypothetical protein
MKARMVVQLDALWVKKEPAKRRVLEGALLYSWRLLDFGFFVDHVLASFGIVLLELELAGCGLFVLVGGVEVSGSSRGNEANFVTHDESP